MQFEYLAYDLLIERIINRIKTLFIYWFFKVPIRERLWNNFHLVYASWWIMFIANMIHFLICVFWNWQWLTCNSSWGVVEGGCTEDNFFVLWSSCRYLWAFFSFLFILEKTWLLVVFFFVLSLFFHLYYSWGWWLENTIQKRRRRIKKRRRKDATINNIGSIARHIVVVIITL